MSDPGQWQAPAGSPWSAPGQPPTAPPPAPVGAPVPQYGQVAPAATPGALPQFGAPPQFGPPVGWTPPPKPGLIPLRPLSLGDVLGGSFQVLRRNPRPTFGFALVLSLILSVVTGGLTALFTAFAVTRVTSASSSDQDAIIAGTVVLGIAGFLVALLLSVAMSTLVQGIVAVEVARGALGEKHTLRGLWGAARGRILALVGWTLLVIAAVLVVLLVVTGLIAVVFLLAGEIAGFITLGVLALIVGLGGTVLGFWLSTKLAFVPVAIVVERRSIRDAVRRSWSLTTGHFWRVLGTLLLVNVIVSFAVQVVSAPLSFLAPFANIIVNPNDSPEAAIAITMGLTVLSLALLSVMSAVALVAQSAAPPLLYLDVRMRVEGLDLTLQRLVEDRAAGRPVPDNPYLPFVG